MEVKKTTPSPSLKKKHPGGNGKINYEKKTFGSFLFYLFFELYSSYSVLRVILPSRYLAKL